MKMNINKFVFQYREEEDESISLSDFPLTPNNQHADTSEVFSPVQDAPSPPNQSDCFEFSSDCNTNMSHAEDIISCGKLVPFDQYSTPNIYQTQNTDTKNERHKLHKFQPQRTRSFAELNIGQSTTSSISSGNSPIRNSRSLDYQKLSSSSSNTPTRNSRSLDYQKLSRNSSLSSDSPEIHRLSSKSTSRFDNTIKIPKPRWYIIMFGSLRLPPEMDLRDIKNRQVHRTVATSLFPSLEVVKKAPVSRKCSWEMLKDVLICKDDASVHVTMSHVRMPRV